MSLFVAAPSEEAPAHQQHERESQYDYGRRCGMTTKKEITDRTLTCLVLQRCLQLPMPARR
jgi:hypothetical protein